MLTGDKLETATCTAKNAHLVTRTQDIHVFRLVSNTHRPLSQGAHTLGQEGCEITAVFQQEIFILLTQFSTLPRVFVSVTACPNSVCCLSWPRYLCSSGTLCCSVTPVKHTLLSSILPQVTNRGEAHLELNAFRRKHDCALVISGDSLEVGTAPEPGLQKASCPKSRV